MTDDLRSNRGANSDNPGDSLPLQAAWYKASRLKQLSFGPFKPFCCSALVGVAVTVLLLPLPKYIAGLLQRFQRKRTELVWIIFPLKNLCSLKIDA